MDDDEKWRRRALRDAVLRRGDSARERLVNAAIYAESILRRHPAMADVTLAIRDLREAREAMTQLERDESERGWRTCARDKCRKHFDAIPTIRRYCSDNCRKRDYVERRRGAVPAKHQTRSAEPRPAPSWNTGPMDNITGGES